MHTIKLKYWFMWGFAALFFLMDYFIRIAPSVMTNQLMATFHVGAFVVGALSGIFYWAYLLMQIPVGVLFDRFGVRIPLIAAVALCTVGVFLFAVAHNLVVLYLARFLTGLAGAFSFVSALKLVQILFPRHYFAVLAGVTQALGMVGAAVGDAPMAALISQYGWRQVTLAITVLFVLLLLGVMGVVRERRIIHSRIQEPVNTRGKIKVIESLIRVMGRAQTWINSAYIGFLYGPTAAFAGLWGVPYFTLYHHESTTMAAAQIGTIFIGLAVGCPVMGWLSNMLGKRLLVMRISAVTSFILISLIIFGDHFPFLSLSSSAVIYSLLFLYGFFDSGIIPSYAVATESNPPQLGGITLGVTNMASLIIGALLLPLIGKILDSVWGGVMLHQHPLYTIANYQSALLLLPLCFIVAFITTFFIKETHCQHLQ